MESAIGIYAEDLILDYVNDELIRNPFPFPMNNILQYTCELYEKKEVRYMSENLERALEKYTKLKKEMIDWDSAIESGRSHPNREEYSGWKAEERKLELNVEKEIYTLLGRSAVNGSNNGMELKKLLESLGKK